MTEQQLLSDTDITEVGRSARVYCELAQRLEPTLADVQLAFVDVGECTHHYGTSVRTTGYITCAITKCVQFSLVKTTVLCVERL